MFHGSNWSTLNIKEFNAFFFLNLCSTQHEKRKKKWHRKQKKKKWNANCSYWTKKQLTIVCIVERFVWNSRLMIKVFYFNKHCKSNFFPSGDTQRHYKKRYMHVILKMFADKITLRMAFTHVSRFLHAFFFSLSLSSFPIIIRSFPLTLSRSLNLCAFCWTLIQLPQNLRVMIEIQWGLFARCVCVCATCNIKNTYKIDSACIWLRAL